MKNYSDKIDRKMSCSVVIPVFNASATIASCIESCLAQTMRPDEIIIVDDYSTDNTWELIHLLAQKYIEIPIICIRNSCNQGVAATRNVGISHAKCKYIAFLDCDDTWHPEKIAICTSILEKFSDNNIVFHNHDVQLDEMSISESSLVYHKETVSAILISNKLQGSSIVIKNGCGLLFDPSFRYAEDIEFGIRYVLTTEILHLECVLTRLNRPQLSEGGLSANRWKMRLGELKAIFSMKRYHFKYWFLIPFLAGFSLLKHLRKSIYFFFRNNK